MTFNQQPFASRIHSMGDEAEGVFELVWPYKWVRFGFNRPPVSMQFWNDFTRYTPDYMDRYGPIECQGFGRDRVLKIKNEKRVALRTWRRHEPQLRFFIWDTTNQRWTYAKWQVVDDLLSTTRLRGAYPEGTPWRGIHFDQLAKLDWHDKKGTENSTRP